MKENPETNLSDIKEVFRDENEETIRIYYYNAKQVKKPYDVKAELIKIIRDYRNPASSRVQAIRELNNALKNQPKLEDNI